MHGPAHAGEPIYRADPICRADTPSHLVGSHRRMASRQVGVMPGLVGLQ